MNASFEEKSVWIQLVSMVLMLGGYFVVAGMMLAGGVSQIVAFVPLFVVAVVLQVVLMVVGYTVVAIASRPEGRDERDRLIEWRSEVTPAGCWPWECWRRSPRWFSRSIESGSRTYS